MLPHVALPLAVEAAGVYAVCGILRDSATSLLGEF